MQSIENSSTLHVFVIKPDKFWEKQKAHMSLGNWNFEQIEMASFDSLSKYVDPSGLPKCVGGTYPYDHDEWLEIRLELEKWIWNITEIMANLESVRKEICEGEQPVDVATADAALKRSHSAKLNIFQIPVDKIAEDAEMVCEKLHFYLK